MNSSFCYLLFSATLSLTDAPKWADDLKVIVETDSLQTNVNEKWRSCSTMAILTIKYHYEVIIICTGHQLLWLPHLLGGSL